MNGALKRKLNEHIEFVATGHPSRFDPLGIAKEIRPKLTYPEQEAVLMDALTGVASAWTKARIGKAVPDQMVFAEFPHVPPIIRAGRGHAVSIEHATAKEIDAHYQKLKVRVRVQEEELEQTVAGLRERMLEELAQAKLELEEVGKLRQMVRRAARTDPDVTAGEVMQRRSEKTVEEGSRSDYPRR